MKRLRRDQPAHFIWNNRPLEIGDHASSKKQNKRQQIRP